MAQLVVMMGRQLAAEAAANEQPRNANTAPNDEADPSC